MDTLKERVEFLLSHRNLTQAEASRRGGFTNGAFINDIVRSQKLSVRGPNLLRLALALQTSPAFLLGETDNPDLIDQGIGSKLGVKDTLANLKAVADARDDYFEEKEYEVVKLASVPREVPVRGVIPCSEDGDFWFSGDDVEWVRRPTGLMNKKDVYALRIEGDNMRPAYRHNALVYVDPHRRPGVGDDAVIEVKSSKIDSNNRGIVYLRRISGISASEISAEQFNPPEVVKISRDIVTALHRVIPWEEAIGI